MQKGMNISNVKVRDCVYFSPSIGHKEIVGILSKLDGPILEPHKHYMDLINLQYRSLDNVMLSLSLLCIESSNLVKKLEKILILLSMLITDNHRCSIN